MTITSLVGSVLCTNSSLLPIVIDSGHWEVVGSIGWLHKIRTRRESRNWNNIYIYKLVCI